MSIKEARFRAKVIPGDVLHLKVKKQSKRGNVWSFLGEAYVGPNRVAEAEYMAMIAQEKIGQEQSNI
jgi:3-hydroxyacyl-[acyl-carrier-protein] dehydratase